MVGEILSMAAIFLRNRSPQHSDIRIFHIVGASSASPARNRRHALLHQTGSQIDVLLNELSLKIVSTSPLRSPRSHPVIGGTKPCLCHRVVMGSGNIPLMACLSTYLVCALPISISAGRVATNSIIRWSQNGSRTSRECAIELRSP